eukprot:3837735-Pleurochrysis_carterae.AAC.4
MGGKDDPDQMISRCVARPSSLRTAPSGGSSSADASVSEACKHRALPEASKVNAMSPPSRAKSALRASSRTGFCSASVSEAARAARESGNLYASGSPSTSDKGPTYRSTSRWAPDVAAWGQPFSFAHLCHVRRKRVLSSGSTRARDHIARFSVAEYAARRADGGCEITHAGVERQLDVEQRGQAITQTVHCICHLFGQHRVRQLRSDWE